MQEMVIEAGHAERNYWHDIWRYRELFWFLAWRDILVRYKQTVLGIAWALLQPFLTMLVFTIVFGRVAKLPSHGVPYAVLVFAALLPWQFFSRALSESSMSLITNTNLISKVYFPRLIVPAGSVVVSLVDFLISFVLLAALMAWYQFWPGARILALLVLVPVAVLAAAGPGLLVSALNVRYRDFRYIVPFMVQLGMYVSPVGFSSDLVPAKWRMLYSLNPLVGVIDGFRWAIIGSPLYLPSLVISAVMIVALLILGIVYFRRTERTFADII
ncbi:MAG TPA: ABC transporter permease [Gemmatimonadaceae bacterium]|nr:ABC transporter permease [Gemmatimonadaceae bacterium]